MKVLIVYGTTEGQTRKIGERVGKHIRDHGHVVELYDSAWVTHLDIDAFDAVVIAASVHQECHQETISDFVMAYRDKLMTKPTAFISVSLSVVLDFAKSEAQAYVDSFVSTTQWKPQKILLLGGALRGAEYDYFQRQIVRYIVMKGGQAPDMEHDYEFTDWNVLMSFVDEFLAAAETRESPPRR